MAIRDFIATHIINDPRTPREKKLFPHHVEQRDYAVDYKNIQWGIYREGHYIGPSMDAEHRDMITARCNLLNLEHAETMFKSGEMPRQPEKVDLHEVYEEA